MSLTDLLPYTQEGVELDKWLLQRSDRDPTKTNSDYLRQGWRVLYVIKANLDKSLYKVGIAGTKSGNAAGRLWEYITYYGTKDEGGDHGVKLYYLGGNKYSSTPSEQSYVYKKEKYIKDKFASDTQKFRGTERFQLGGLRNIMRAIRYAGYSVDTDYSTPLRRSARILQKNDESVLNPSDSFDIISHDDIGNDRSKVSRYTLKWTRPWANGSYLTTGDSEKDILAMVDKQFEGLPNREAKVNEAEQKLKDYKADNSYDTFNPA